MVARFATALALLIAFPVFAEDLTRTDALVKLCEVWSAVKYQHPQLMQRDVDWDGALLRAVPGVREAKSHDELAAAVGTMLAELNDPVTKVAKESAEVEPTGAEVPLHRRDGEVLIVDFGPYADAKGPSALYGAQQTLAAEMAKAGSLVFDLRTSSEAAAAAVEYAFDSLGGLVIDPVPGVASRIVYHSGYAPQLGSTSGGYYSGLLTLASPPVEKGFSPVTAAPRIVIVTRGENLPADAIALWLAGRAAIVSEAALTDAVLGGAKKIALGGGWEAAVRTADLLAPAVVADAVVPRGPEDATMKKALEIARAATPFAARPSASPAASVPRVRKEAAYAEMSAPDLPHRMLALFRLWGVIDLFYPYKHLIGDWDAVLRDSIPRFEEAADAKAYGRAILETVARVEDGHSGAWGAAALELLGGAFMAQVEIRAVDGQYVVTNLGADVPKDAPIRAGDVVVSIDGEPLADRVARLHKLITASHETARLNKVLANATRGPAKETPAELGLRNDDGTTRVVKLPRVRQWPDWKASKGDEVWRVLGGNIGYVDLTRLTVPQVDPMLEALKGTKAIIFDMRGYPNGTAWSIAPRINTRNAKVGAAFRRAQITGYSSEESASGFFFEQPLPKSDKPKYTGPTVMLIDDRTISQAEHSGLFYEAANGTKFIGTNSAGANGDVTNFPLPGGYRVVFTGHDVRHADGRQLQRVGLEPDVRVAPTLRGIREGKDEVLERAIRYLNEGR